MTLPSALTNHDDLMRRIASDLVDTYDAEIELALAARSLDEQVGRHVTDRAERQAYFKELFRLQGELVKLQDWVQHTRKKVVILFEGRDAAGKGGVIKRITQRLNPRVVRVAALPPTTASARSGTFSATPRTCPLRARWCCLIAAGTTARGLSA